MGNPGKRWVLSLSWPKFRTSSKQLVLHHMGCSENMWRRKPKGQPITDEGDGLGQPEINGIRATQVPGKPGQCQQARAWCERVREMPPLQAKTAETRSPSSHGTRSKSSPTWPRTRWLRTRPKLPHKTLTTSPGTNGSETEFYTLQDVEPFAGIPVCGFSQGRFFLKS